ncbi:MAG: RDD family protein [Leadbetterella sp.]|nr:RDD family protein [Leadbetterella sp.]
METLKIPTFLNVDLSIQLAGTWRRYFAFMIDWVFKGVYILLVFYAGADRYVPGYLFPLLFLPVYFYSFLAEGLFIGQTPGKMLMRVKVVGRDGNPPSLTQCLVRWMFLFVDAYSTVLLAFVNSWAVVFTAFGPLVGIARIERSPFRQRYGDMAADTFVVNTRDEYSTVEDTIYSYMDTKRHYVVTYPEVIRFSDKDMTLVKNLLEKSEKNYDDELLDKLAKRIKELLEISSEESNPVFLKKLLNDYNYLSLK